MVKTRKWFKTWTLALIDSRAQKRVDKVESPVSLEPSSSLRETSTNGFFRKITKMLADNLDAAL